MLPSGSKVRQYARMCKAAPGAPTLVGCSAYSAQQIYVAAAAKAYGVPGYVYLPARAKETEATGYARAMGAEVNAVRPGYPSVYRAAARGQGAKLGRYVHWDVAGAVQDAAAQAQNVPAAAKRVVIPTGSGLTAAGVLAGLAGRPNPPIVVAVAVSKMATRKDILAHARKAAPPGAALPPLTVVRLKVPYEKWRAAALPDGTPLDPWYAAKVLPYVRPGDCFWPPGLRPVCAMPPDCQKAFNGWHPAGAPAAQTVDC